MNLCLEPSRGQVEEPGSLDANIRRDTFKKNQRSLTSRLRRREKRRNFNVNRKKSFRNLKSYLKPLFEDTKQLKTKIQQLRL